MNTRSQTPVPGINNVLGSRTGERKPALKLVYTWQAVGGNLIATKRNIKLLNLLLQKNAITQKYLRKKIKEMFSSLSSNEMCQQYCCIERTYGFHSECKMSKLFSKISIKLASHCAPQSPAIQAASSLSFDLKMVEKMAEAPVANTTGCNNARGICGTVPGI